MKKEIKCFKLSVEKINYQTVECDDGSFLGKRKSSSSGHYYEVDIKIKKEIVDLSVYSSWTYVGKCFVVQLFL